MGKERGRDVSGWIDAHQKELVLGSIPVMAVVAALLFEKRGDHLSSRVCYSAVPLILGLIAFYLAGEKAKNF